MNVHCFRAFVMQACALTNVVGRVGIRIAWSHFLEQGNQSFACTHTWVMESGLLGQLTFINLMLKNFLPTLYKPSLLSQDDKGMRQIPWFCHQEGATSVLYSLVWGGQVLPNATWRRRAGGWWCPGTGRVRRGVWESDFPQLVFADGNWIKENNCPHRTDLQSSTIRLFTLVIYSRKQSRGREVK